ncbi:AAA family ATPase [Herbaspirillum robiniae]|uniref:AAA family ATPase n=1 Tax=Herbaspirillum robiniae TaxID=2014887 RepID=UPI003D76F1BA
MKFRIVDSVPTSPPRNGEWNAYLLDDSWDDWNKYRTQFYLVLIDPDGTKHDIGSVKVGQCGLKPHKKIKVSDIPPGYRKPALPSPFAALDEDFFSLGQDPEYYENLNALGDDIRDRVLSSLKDIARDIELWGAIQNEDVLDESLLRSVTRSTVEGQFRRMAQGHARVTPYSFEYTPPKRMGDGAPPFTLDFKVNPKSPVPTNVHVLIGRNGVGKTRLLSLMTKALVAKDASAKQSGKFEFNESNESAETFANVIGVSFSAFDENDLLPERNPEPDSLGFSYIGIRDWSSSKNSSGIKPKTPGLLASEFVNSLKECRIGSKRLRWTAAMRVLQSDPVFKAAELINMIDTDFSEKEQHEEVLKIFKALSSGHKIVLLILTRLVEKVEERTLVLIDEPEAHLHPPLLAAMTRAISELLVSRNGVAIVATHSPIILQEVPRSCVWIIDRILTAAKVERPSIETFAENVGILSREVFQLELSQSGYNQLLLKLSQEYEDYEDAIDHMKNRIGSEGKAVLRAMFLGQK